MVWCFVYRKAVTIGCNPLNNFVSQQKFFLPFILQLSEQVYRSCILLRSFYRQISCFSHFYHIASETKYSHLHFIFRPKYHSAAKDLQYCVVQFPRNTEKVEDKSDQVTSSRLYRQVVLGLKLGPASFNLLSADNQKSGVLDGILNSILTCSKKLNEKQYFFVPLGTTTFTVVVYVFYVYLISAIFGYLVVPKPLQ